MEYRYISADNHLDAHWLPKQLWQERLAEKYRSRGPKVIETPKGSYWEWEGKRRGQAADGSSNEKLLGQYFPGVEVPAGSLPPSTPSLLLKHLDMASIYAGVFYGDTRKWLVEDPQLLLEIYRAYNDFVMEMNDEAPDRLIVLPNLPTALPEACPAELQRLIKRGAKAVEFGVFDVAEPVYQPVWEPIWAMAAEANIPLCSHIGAKAGTGYPQNYHGASLAHYSTVPMSLANSMAQIVFSGAFARHPKLRFSFAECRIGWLPFFITWMDRQVHERETDESVGMDMLPSEYIKRGVTFTFEEDYVGARLLQNDWAHLAETAIWGSDYPHEQGTWPDPHDVIERMFEGASQKLKQEILFDRAARLFGIHGGIESRRKVV